MLAVTELSVFFKKKKQKLLDSLITKTEPLTELEIALKNKLITDMLSS